MKLREVLEKFFADAFFPVVLKFPVPGQRVEQHPAGRFVKRLYDAVNGLAGIEEFAQSRIMSLKGWMVKYAEEGAQEVPIREFQKFRSVGQILAQPQIETGIACRVRENVFHFSRKGIVLTVFVQCFVQQFEQGRVGFGFQERAIHRWPVLA